MPPPRPAADLESLAAVSLLVARWVERVLGRHAPPITVAQFLALRAIDREALTAAELARRAGTSDPAVSQLVAGLESSGWVVRSTDPADRRRLGLALTSAGSGALEAASALVRDELSTLASELPHRDLDDLARLLPGLERVIAGSPPPRRPPPPHPRRRGPETRPPRPR
jgi:DNA-binding MarR family transcriptional regulator